jgi:uncharacterized membrane protein
MIRFFSREDEQRIIAAIGEIEQRSSGEVRVHLTNTSPADVLREARATFIRLEMHRTPERNGVLLFLAPKCKSFAIVGDEGIDRLVEKGFWEKVRDMAAAYFQRGAFGDGVLAALAEVGAALKKHFPAREKKINRMPDDISYG